jgi:hypothetical protein
MNLILEEYSEKSYVIYGPFSEIQKKYLNENNGKFNSNLRDGEGYIFSKQFIDGNKSSELKAWISSQKKIEKKLNLLLKNQNQSRPQIEAPQIKNLVNKESFELKYNGDEIELKELVETQNKIQLQIYECSNLLNYLKLESCLLKDKIFDIINRKNKVNNIEEKETFLYED